MASGLERVLLHGFGAERADLAARIRQLGYEALTEPDPRGPAPRVVVIPADFTLPQRAGELGQLSRAAGPHGVSFVALGTRPAPAQRDALRAKQVRHAVWSPFHDGELRFVLNRAAHDPDDRGPRVGQARGAARAAGASLVTGWQAKSL